MSAKYSASDCSPLGLCTRQRARLKHPGFAQCRVATPLDLPTQAIAPERLCLDPVRARRNPRFYWIALRRAQGERSQGEMPWKAHPKGTSCGARRMAILAGYALEGASNGDAGGTCRERRMDIGLQGTCRHTPETSFSDQTIASHPPRSLGRDRIAYHRVSYREVISPKS